MFREIELHPEERDFHRFLVRGEGGELVDACMTRLTLGVKSSLFLATQVLRHDYQQEFPQAAEIFQKRFYVDDCLTGAESVEEAIPIVEGMTSLCQRGGMTLRKFRTNSKELREAIPTELLETSDLNISTSPSEHGKTLGLHWDTERDVFHVATPCLKPAVVPTKRQILSDIARTYNVMGWCAPAMVKAKIMVQRLWQQDLGWDQDVTGELAQEYHKWRKQLPSLTSIAIPCCYFRLDHSRVSIQLYGFVDATQAAYRGVLYLHVVYKDTSTETALIMAKSRVAPLQTKTIPKLELEGARVLAQMMQVEGAELGIPKEHTYAWSDSTIVLSWLVTCLKVYVAHRAAEIVGILEADRWRHVPTDEKPADLVSSGVFPEELAEAAIWWKGPPWLSKSPSTWPKCRKMLGSKELPELKSTVLSVLQSTGRTYRTTTSWSDAQPGS